MSVRTTVLYGAVDLLALSNNAQRNLGDRSIRLYEMGTW